MQQCFIFIHERDERSSIPKILSKDEIVSPLSTGLTYFLSVPLQTRDRRDGHGGFQVDGELPSAPHSGSVSGVGHPTNSTDRSAQEASETELKTVTVNTGHDLHIAPAYSASLMTFLCTVIQGNAK